MLDNKKENTLKIRDIFFNYLQRINYEGIIGVAKFSNVYKDLMPVQQGKLKNVLGNKLGDFLKNGSIISIGICYPSNIIDCINVKENGKINKIKWNKYAEEYYHLNLMLKEIGAQIAKKFNFFSFPPTTGVPAENITNVIDYYSHTISHRVVAEHAGLGWRGKNELLISKIHGPIVRFTSILANIPLNKGQKMENQCGECSACLDACSILKKKELLKDYRENCRKYIISLGLKHDICGKCIKACYIDSIFKEKFK